MSATFSRMMAELAGWCVMNNIFNTSFEISLRVLLTLESAPLQWWTADLIAASDFITVYSGDFDIASENLHGVNSFKYSEFALRREMVKEALKALVARKPVSYTHLDVYKRQVLALLGNACLGHLALTTAP